MSRERESKRISVRRWIKEDWGKKYGLMRY